MTLFIFIKKRQQLADLDNESDLGKIKGKRVSEGLVEDSGHALNA